MARSICVAGLQFHLRPKVVRKLCKSYETVEPMITLGHRKVVLVGFDTGPRTL